MLVLNTRNIGKSGGLYSLNADRNLTELKRIMKELLVKEIPLKRGPLHGQIMTQSRFQLSQYRLKQRVGVSGLIIQGKKSTVKTFAL